LIERSPGIRFQTAYRNRSHYEVSKGPKYFLEIKDAGHFTFTSVDQYNPNYGDGIGKGTRITVAGQEVTYLPPEESHKMIDAYALAFLSVHVRASPDITRSWNGITTATR